MDDAPTTVDGWLEFDDTKAAYLDATQEQAATVDRYLCGILAVLRAQHLSYQTSHWQVVGGSFYGNHLLFERLYKSVQDQVDQLAEKIIGYVGIEALNLAAQLEKIHLMCGSWGRISCHHKRGLQSEADLQAAIKLSYDAIKGAGLMTLGLDDWLMATANAHEENTYLLQQVLAPVPGEKQAARPPEVRIPRRRKDLIGFYYALHDALEKDINFGVEDLQAMSDSDLRREATRLAQGLESTPRGDEAAVRALKNAPAAYRMLTRMTGVDKLGSDKQAWGRFNEVRYPSVQFRKRAEQADKELSAAWRHVEPMEDGLHRYAKLYKDLLRDLPRDGEWKEAHERAKTQLGRIEKVALKEAGELDKTFHVMGDDIGVLIGVLPPGDGKTAAPADSGAGSDEDKFYKDPEKREVKEFAESKAISNSVEVVESHAAELDIPEAKAVAEAEEAPLLPTEIAEEPGGKALSTLNRYVIKTEDPETEPAVKMNEERMAAWSDEIDARGASVHLPPELAKALAEGRNRVRSMSVLERVEAPIVEVMGREFPKLNVEVGRARSGSDEVELFVKIDSGRYGGHLYINPWDGKWKLSGFAPSFDPEGGSTAVKESGRMKPWPFTGKMEHRGNKASATEVMALIRRWKGTSHIGRWAHSHLKRLVTEAFPYA